MCRLTKALKQNVGVEVGGPIEMGRVSAIQVNDEFHYKRSDVNGNVVEAAKYKEIMEVPYATSSIWHKV